MRHSCGSIGTQQSWPPLADALIVWADWQPWPEIPLKKAADRQSAEELGFVLLRSVVGSALSCDRKRLRHSCWRQLDGWQWPSEKSCVWSWCPPKMVAAELLVIAVTVGQLAPVRCRPTAWCFRSETAERLSNFDPKHSGFDGLKSHFEGHSFLSLGLYCQILQSKSHFPAILCCEAVFGAARTGGWPLNFPNFRQLRTRERLKCPERLLSGFSSSRSITRSVGSDGLCAVITSTPIYPSRLLVEIDRSEVFQWNEDCWICQPGEV